eukprot:6210618-Pleurochrysis_carterae.AAC.1
MGSAVPTSPLHASSVSASATASCSAELHPWPLTPPVETVEAVVTRCETKAAPTALVLSEALIFGKLADRMRRATSPSVSVARSTLTSLVAVPAAISVAPVSSVPPASVDVAAVFTDVVSCASLRAPVLAAPSRHVMSVHTPFAVGSRNALTPPMPGTKWTESGERVSGIASRRITFKLPGNRVTSALKSLERATTDARTAEFTPSHPAIRSNVPSSLISSLFECLHVAVPRTGSTSATRAL